MNQPKIPKGFFHWTPAERERWIAKHVKPDRDYHEVAVSVREGGDVMVLECSCGWDTDVKEFSLRALNREAREHRLTATAAKKRKAR